MRSALHALMCGEFLWCTTSLHALHSQYCCPQRMLSVDKNNHLFWFWCFWGGHRAYSINKQVYLGCEALNKMDFSFMTDTPKDKNVIFLLNYLSAHASAENMMFGKRSTLKENCPITLKQLFSLWVPTAQLITVAFDSRGKLHKRHTMLSDLTDLTLHGDEKRGREKILITWPRSHSQSMLVGYSPQ